MKGKVLACCPGCAARFPAARFGLPPFRQGAPWMGRPHLSRSRLLPAALTQRPGPRSHQLNSRCRVGAACPPPRRGGRCSPRGDGACGALGEGGYEGIPRPPRWGISAGCPTATYLCGRVLTAAVAETERSSPSRSRGKLSAAVAGRGRLRRGREGLRAAAFRGPAGSERERGAQAGRLPSAS